MTGSIGPENSNAAPGGVADTGVAKSAATAPLVRSRRRMLRPCSPISVPSSACETYE
jgi:hypothetical protein